MNLLFIFLISAGMISLSLKDELAADNFLPVERVYPDSINTINGYKTNQNHTSYSTVPLEEAKEVLQSKTFWSIGILSGNSPFELNTPKGIKNPVITPEDITDFKADIIAHPFLMKEDSCFYMFFSVKQKASGKGGIGLASSRDGLHWNYKQMVIRDDVIHSHPNVFKWKGDYYLVPETHADSSVRIYKAIEFPYSWELEGTLLDHGVYISPTLFRFKGIWWMFTSPSNNILKLFYADELMGKWVEHPESPLVKNNPEIARPAGVPILYKGNLYRLGMNCIPSYGYSVSAFLISGITQNKYLESSADSMIIKASGSGWNSHAMHHLSVVKTNKKLWLAAVDAAQK
jgi:hypothetical protein